VSMTIACFLLDAIPLFITILGQISVVSGERTHDAGFRLLLSLERGRGLREERPCDDVGSPASPSSGDRIGEYTLSECVASGSYGMVWMANASKGSTPAVVKVPRGGDDLRDECLFSQMIARRDPEHFVDCLEVGTFPKGYHYMVQEKAEGKTFSEVSANLTGLVETISFWMQLFDANEHMFATNDGDQFKFINPDFHGENVMLNFEESGEPKVKLIDYGQGVICCMGGLPEDCQAFLRNGATVDAPQPKRFPMCENLESSEHNMAEKLQTIALVVTAVMSLYEKEHETREMQEAWDVIAKSPLDASPCIFREQVYIASDAKPVIQRFVTDILKSMVDIVLEGLEAHTDSIIALPGKLREVHAELSKLKLRDIRAQASADCMKSM